MLTQRCSYLIGYGPRWLLNLSWTYQTDYQSLNHYCQQLPSHLISSLHSCTIWDISDMTTSRIMPEGLTSASTMLMDTTKNPSIPLIKICEGAITKVTSNGLTGPNWVMWCVQMMSLLALCEVESYVLGEILLVMCKGLSTLQGSGVGVRRVRVRVRILWPSTNPWPFWRVRGFSGVFQGFLFL